MEEAKELARIMVKIGHLNAKETVCVLTNMDQPLGNAIGNSLEVMEAIDILKNDKVGHLRDLCITLSSYMVSLGLGISYDEALGKVENAINS